MSNSAQDEYNQLFRNKERSNKHPEDQALHSGDESDNNTKEGYYEQDDESEEERGRTKDKMVGRYYIPSMHSNANTGPKGVIADAQAFEEARKAQRHSYIPTKNTASVRHSMIVSTEEKDSFDDNKNEGFMAEWRAKRLEELRNAVRLPSRSRTRSPNKRVYGNLATVDASGYLDALEKTPADTNVVVLIYDDQSEVSNLVEKYVRKVARQNNATRFVKLHYLDAEFESAGVPALLAYRGGEKFADMIPVTDELPDGSDLSTHSLEAALRQRRVIS